MPILFPSFHFFHSSLLIPKRLVSMEVEAKCSTFFNNQREMIMNESVNLGSENLLPIYRSAICESAMDRATVYPVSRKRGRDCFNNSYGDDFGSFHFCIEKQQHQHLLEVDRIISLHNERVRLDIDERRKKYSRRMIGMLEEGMMKTLKDKDEVIENIGKLNWALEERVKCLFMENQILRELAERSEATANALRSNLEQALAQEQEQQINIRDQETTTDELEAESCCNADNNNMMMMMTMMMNENENENENDHRVCKCCGEMESCVLLLPCRHLSLCTVCGSSVHVCPVCNSPMTASVHVNFSSY